MIGFLALLGIMLDLFYLCRVRKAFQQGNDNNNNNDEEEDGGNAKGSPELSFMHLFLVIDHYLPKVYYQLTYFIFIPLLGFVHLPLNVSLVLYVFFRATPPSPTGLRGPKRVTEPALFFTSFYAELLSLSAQVGLSYYFLLSPLGFQTIRYNYLYWRYTYACFLDLALLFLGNDGAALLTVVYLNRLKVAGSGQSYLSR